MDINLKWNGQQADIDFLLDDVKKDDGLETAIIYSLFTDAREADERGWWGNSIVGENEGSLLWLLEREKMQGTVLVKAKKYASDALAWLVKDGIVKAVVLNTKFVGNNKLQIDIEVKKLTDKEGYFSFNINWK